MDIAEMIVKLRFQRDQMDQVILSFENQLAHPQSQRRARPLRPDTGITGAAPGKAPVCSAAKDITGQEEISDHLEFLIEHGRECKVENCHSCMMLQGICELIRQRIFSSFSYPTVVALAASPHAAAEICEAAPRRRRSAPKDV